MGSACLGVGVPALTRVYNIYIYICVMLVFEYSHGSKGRAQRTVIDIIVTGNWH